MHGAVLAALTARDDVNIFFSNALFETRKSFDFFLSEIAPGRPNQKPWNFELHSSVLVAQLRLTLDLIYEKHETPWYPTIHYSHCPVIQLAKANSKLDLLELSYIKRGGQS